VKTTLLLCDHAQEVAGKLYILGGGWSIYRGAPVTMGLAVKISIPWDAANIPHDFTARLVTEDGQDPVLPKPEGGAAETRVEFQGRFEAGRPAGLAPGSELDAPFAVNIAGLPLAPGRYEWQVEIDQVIVGQVAFAVVEG
jgi:Family of unknown function (DUF6941)